LRLLRLRARLVGPDRRLPGHAATSADAGAVLAGLASQRLGVGAELRLVPRAPPGGQRHQHHDHDDGHDDPSDGGHAPPLPFRRRYPPGDAFLHRTPPARGYQGRPSSNVASSATRTARPPSSTTSPWWSWRPRRVSTSPLTLTSPSATTGLASAPVST